jgi:hypothetical protein
MHSLVSQTFYIRWLLTAVWLVVFIRQYLLFDIVSFRIIVEVFAGVQVFLNIMICERKLTLVIPACRTNVGRNHGSEGRIVEFQVISKAFFFVHIL